MANKISSAVSNFVRTIFNREQLLRQQLSIADPSSIFPANRFTLAQLPGIDASLFGYVGDTLGLDRRRLYRYSDYEQMDEYPDISSALDIYADDATQTDSTTRKSVWIECQNDQVRDDLDNVFYKRLRMGETIWEIARQLCKYGNEFDEIVVGDMGVVGLNYLPTATMHRIEAPGGITKGFVQSYATDIQINHKTVDHFKFAEGGGRDGNKDAILYEDWRVVHWRLRSKNRDSVYGWAVTEPARWVWKRLKLLEDAVMVYKLTRSPSRYLFTIDVSNMSTQQAERKLQEAKQRLKKRKFINPETGKPDFRYSPLAMDEDFFVGSRDGKEQTRVDTLNGPAYQQVEDVEYFLNKLYAALKVPRAYLGYDENMPSKATLSQEDVRFAMTILRIQNEIRTGLHKIGRVHLASRNIDPASVDFKIAMTVPSAIFELGQMEVRRARADLASQMERHVSLYWLLSNVYALSDDEITQIMKQKEDETKKAQSMGGGGGFESLIYGPGSSSSTGYISERELFKGNKEHEKRMEDIVKRAMESQDSRMGLRLRQTEYFLRELLHALQNKRAA